MKIKQVSILLVLLILSSCYNVKKPKKPENLISEDNMVNILVDIAVMSSAKGVNKSKIEKNGIIPDDFIYKKNNIDSLTFAENNAYYAFDIKKYETIYKRVKDSLTIVRDKYKAIDKKERAEKKAKDSIRRAKAKEDILKNNNKKSKKKFEVGTLKKD